MKASTKRSLSLIGSALLLIGAAVLYTSAIKPAYRNIQQLRASLIAKTNLFNEQKEIISRVKALLNQYQSAARLQETISLALPPDEAVAPLFQQVFAISQASGIKIQSFGLTAEAIKPDGLGTLKLNLGLQGSYESLKSFLQSIETNIRVMDVTQLGTQKDLHSVSLTTYYQTK